MGLLEFGKTLLTGAANVIKTVGRTLVPSLTAAGGTGLGSRIMSFAAGLFGPRIPILGPTLGQLVIRAAIRAICWIAEKVNVKEEEETPEEIGMKAEESDKKPDEFDSCQAYIEYLRKEVALDKERLERMTEEERLGYAAVGSGIYARGVEEKYNNMVSLDPEFIEASVQAGINAEQLKTMLDRCEEFGVRDTADIYSFLAEGRLPEDLESSSLDELLMDAMRVRYPELSEDELADKLTELENRIRSNKNYLDDAELARPEDFLSASDVDAVVSSSEDNE